MNIGVDMDSVLAEIIEPLDSFHNIRYQTNLQFEDHSVYNLMGLWNCTETEMIDRIHEFYLSSYFAQTKPIKGAVEGITKLAKKNKLILITSRPLFIEDMSQKWLDNYFKGKFVKICHTNQVTQAHEKKIKKSDVCVRESVEIMIDDHLDYAYDCAQAGIQVLLFEAPWNKKRTIEKKYKQNIKRVSNWTEITDLLCI